MWKNMNISASRTIGREGEGEQRANESSERKGRSFYSGGRGVGCSCVERFLVFLECTVPQPTTTTRYSFFICIAFMVIIIIIDAYLNYVQCICIQNWKLEILNLDLDAVLTFLYVFL